MSMTRESSWYESLWALVVGSRKRERPTSSWVCSASSNTRFFILIFCVDRFSCAKECGSVAIDT